MISKRINVEVSSVEGHGGGEARRYKEKRRDARKE